MSQVANIPPVQPAPIYRSSYPTVVNTQYPPPQHGILRQAQIVPQIVRKPVAVEYLPVPVQTVSVKEHERIYYRTPAHSTPPTSSNIVDDVNKFVNRTSSRPFVTDLETYGNFRKTSRRSQDKSDIESAFVKTLRGNIFEPKFII